MLDIASSIKAEFIATKLQGLKDPERAWLSSSPSSSSQVFSHLRKGRYQQPPAQHSSASDSAGVTRFGTLLLPTEILEIPPHLQLEARRRSTLCSTCVWTARGVGDANRMSLFVCEEEWKHEGCYFSRVHGLKYGDGTQSTKNIMPNFKLRGTQLGQWTLKTLEHCFLLPKQSHTPKIHVSRKYIGLIK